MTLMTKLMWRVKRVRKYTCVISVVELQSMRTAQWNLWNEFTSTSVATCDAHRSIR